MRETREESDRAESDRADRDRAERWQLLLVGIPLTLVLLVPWDAREGVFAWTLPASLAAPIVGMGVCGALLVLASIAAPRLRRIGTVLAGAGALALSFWLLEAIVSGPEVRLAGVRHLSFMATRTWSLLLVLTAGAEMAMHRRPRSRALAVTALGGWLGILVALFVPVGGALELRRAPAVALGRLLAGTAGDEYEALLPLYLTTAFFALVALVGVGQCARRVGLNRRVAAERRFRSPWLAWALFPGPMLAFTAVVLVKAAIDSPSNAARLYFLFALTFGPLLGGALAWRTLLEGELVKLTARRVLFGIDVVLLSTILGIGLWNGFHPDARDVAVGALSEDLGVAVRDALRGDAIDARFLGDYGDFDLRAAEPIDLPEGTRIDLVALRVSADMEDHRRTAYALTLPDGRVRWVARDGVPVRWELAEWRAALSEGAIRGYGAAIHRLQDAGCLLFVDDYVVKAPDIRAELGGFEPVCHGAARLRTLSSQHGRNEGVVDRYVVGFLTPEGERISFGGSIHPHREGRVWLGPPTRLPRPEPEEP